MESTNIIFARRAPWNKGKLIGQKAPLKLKEIWAIRVRLQLEIGAASLHCSLWPSTSSFARANW